MVSNIQNIERRPYQEKKKSVTPTSLLISTVGLSNETPLLSNIRVALNPRIHWLPNFQSQPKHFIPYIPVSGKPLLSLANMLIAMKSGKSSEHFKDIFVCWSCQASPRAFLDLLWCIIYSFSLRVWHVIRWSNLLLKFLLPVFQREDIHCLFSPAMEYINFQTVSDCWTLFRCRASLSPVPTQLDMLWITKEAVLIYKVETPTKIKG